VRKEELWVKALNGNYMNELADQLAQDAANSNELETTYSKIPKVQWLERYRNKVNWCGKVNGTPQPRAK
jgi:ribonuclease HI